MSDANTGGPAFPTATLAQKTEGGMTLRDYFAAKAMQGMIGGDWPASQSEQNHIAEFSYQLADAMLKARSA
jgi:hypothetical protein